MKAFPATPSLTEVVSYDDAKAAKNAGDKRVPVPLGTARAFRSNCEKNHFVVDGMPSRSDVTDVYRDLADKWIEAGAGGRGSIDDVAYGLVIREWLVVNRVSWDAVSKVNDRLDWLKIGSERGNHMKRVMGRVQTGAYNAEKLGTLSEDRLSFTFVGSDVVKSTRVFLDNDGNELEAPSASPYVVQPSRPSAPSAAPSRPSAPSPSAVPGRFGEIAKRLGRLGYEQDEIIDAVHKRGATAEDIVSILMGEEEVVVMQDEPVVEE